MLLYNGPVRASLAMAGVGDSVFRKYYDIYEIGHNVI